MALVLIGGGGCATLQQVAAWLQVDFFVDGTSQGTLAGVPIERLKRFEELRTQDLLRLAAALAEGRLPLAFTLHVGATNPPDNGMAGSLLALDWRLLVRGRETVQGRFDQITALPPGATVDLPIRVEMDLKQFFDEDLRDLVDLALDTAGEGGGTTLRLVGRPTIQTPVGPLQYPEDITITSR